MKTKLTIFWVRLTRWEYWPWQVVYIPIFVYWLWCGIKTRAIFWISAVNPGFEYGGIIGASKKTILSSLPHEYLPKTVLVKAGTPIVEVEPMLAKNNLEFPLIIKPDIGERGFHVALLNSREDLEAYLETIQEDHLIQEYLNMPVELGVFYYRYPNHETGAVTSVVRKGMLTVVGDGMLTVRQLMNLNVRAMQQIRRLEISGTIKLEQVLQEGEELLLEPIGNHNRGTTFLNANYLINDQLVAVFDELAGHLKGFYYGRFDLRCNSLEDLYEGKLKVMEVNGAASEPAHIYSPGYPLLKGYKELFKHWRILYKISVMNHKKGVPYMSFSTGWGALKKSRFNRS